MKRIAMFGGSFNPIHNGHLHLLEICKEKMRFDQVLLIPSQRPVHKISHDMAPGEKRAEMCRMAVRDLPWCTVDEMELNRAEKSYTVLSLRTLRQRYPCDELYLLVGSDMFLSFDEWYQYEEILSLAQLCVIGREAEDESEQMEEMRRKLGKIGLPIHIIPCTPMPVSSTQIRQMIQNGEPIDRLVPKEVAQYIEKEELYIR